MIFLKVTYSILLFEIGCWLLAFLLLNSNCVWLSFSGGKFVGGLLSCRWLCCPVSFWVNCLTPVCHFPSFVASLELICWFSGLAGVQEKVIIAGEFRHLTSESISLEAQALPLLPQKSNAQLICPQLPSGDTVTCLLRPDCASWRYTRDGQLVQEYLHRTQKFIG